MNYHVEINNKMSLSEVSSFLNLFKIFPMSYGYDQDDCLVNSVQDGIIVIDEECKILKSIPFEIYQILLQYFGCNKERFNNTFYKNFNDVVKSTTEELVNDQLLHYFTTYGAEQFGVNIPTYIPASELNLNGIDINADYKFIVIQRLPEKDCIAKFDKYLQNLTAVSEKNRDLIKNILHLSKIDVEKIKSFEIQAIKHTQDNTVPQSPVNFLRFLVYKTTDTTLLIKNRILINTIKANANNSEVSKLLSLISEEKLATIFLRYKPIFLAFKKYPKCGPIINRIRRKAEIFHKPLEFNCLQNLVNIKNRNASKEIISKATNRELIKVINSLRFSLGSNDITPMVYTIRNGKSFVKGPQKLNITVETAYLVEDLMKELILRFSHLKGKRFYIPSYIDYAAPTTEKQFTGNIPYGTKLSINANEGFALGIHWFNQNNKRTDLDLHLSSATKHFGWNSGYKDDNDNDDCEIVYTGDVTDAPEPLGAAEAFWCKIDKSETYLASVHNYTENPEIEFKMFLTRVNPKNDIKRFSSYTYNPNEEMFPAIPIKFNNDSSAKSLGLLKGNTFYFYGNNTSSGIVPKKNYESFIQGLAHQLNISYTLKELFYMGDAHVYDEKDIKLLSDAELKDVVFLAPEDLSTDTLMNIIDNK